MISVATVTVVAAATIFDALCVLLLGDDDDDDDDNDDAAPTKSIKDINSNKITNDVYFWLLQVLLHISSLGLGQRFFAFIDSIEK